MNTSSTRIIAHTVALIGAIVFSARLDSQATSPSFAGTWVLDRKAGDTADHQDRSRAFVDAALGRARIDSTRLERMRRVLREIVEIPEQLRVVETESMVIITGGSGYTTRLAPGAGQIKDESSGITRKTHWRGDILVTEITGVASGKLIETYSLDAARRLHVAIEFSGARRPELRAIRRIYDAAGQSEGPYRLAP